MTYTLEVTLNRIKKRCWVFLPRVNERVQVPTGSHSQTAVTGWSNYGVADTPAWSGFISSRKRDSQITVYPHRGSQFGAWSRSCKQRSHTDPLRSHACTRAQKLHRGIEACRDWHPPPFFFLLHMYRPCVCRCVATCLDPALGSCQTHLLAPSKHAGGQHYAGVCVWEGTRERIGETDDTRGLFNVHPHSLNNNSTLEDASFDPLTHRCISHAAAYAANSGLYLSL